MRLESIKMSRIVILERGYEQDGYLMLSGDPGISKGFDIQEDAHEYLLDVVDGLLKENR